MDKRLTIGLLKGAACFNCDHTQIHPHNGSDFCGNDNPEARPDSKVKYHFCKFWKPDPEFYKK